MIEINWDEDYKREFICPQCSEENMKIKGRNKCNQKYFYCLQCNKYCLESSRIDIEAVKDPLNSSIVWYTGYRIPEFVCPN